jgi:glycosyltransferase involved in cell wall biosynthesis
VARLHRQKGLVYLIRAAGRIFNGAPAARIVVVGGGPLEKALQKEIARRGLEGRFHLLGERADSARILSLLDIFVLPSLWEGLPYVLLEAASFGKPIVATAIDGVTEVLQDGQTGLLVPPADSGSLASAVLRLLKDHQLAAELGRSARPILLVQACHDRSGRNGFTSRSGSVL